MEGRGDDKPQFVDQSLFEQRLGQCDAPMHADVSAGPLPQLADELDEATIDDRSIGPGFFGCCRGHDELLDAVDEARERLDVTGWPEPGPVVVRSAPEEHGVLGGDYAVEVFPHCVIELGDELVRLLCHPVEGQQFVGDYLAHHFTSLSYFGIDAKDVPLPQNSSPAQKSSGRILLVKYPFQQVDVFTRVPFEGNPVAVVLDADGLTGDEMQRLARWTNLSETTFVLRPQAAEANYRLRIFTPSRELPFAGHPTLGSCHAWLAASQSSPAAEVVLQECGAGLVPLRRTADGLAFAAPPLLRYEPVEEPLIEHIAELLHITRAEIVDAHWVDNGPGWVAVLLSSAEAVLDLRPGTVDLDVGVVGPYPQGSASAFEVRAFFPVQGATVEDPVTGSLNASLAHWLLETGRATSPYVASQGTALGRAGRVHISSDADGKIWVGGGTITCIAGSVEM